MIKKHPSRRIHEKILLFDGKRHGALHSMNFNERGGHETIDSIGFQKLMGNDGHAEAVQFKLW